MFEDIKQAAYECGNDIDKLTEMILCKFCEQKETWMLLLSDNANLGFQSKIYSFFEGHFVKDDTPKESKLKYRFLLYGYSGLIDNWAKNSMKEPPVEMAGYINALRHERIRTK